MKDYYNLFVELSLEQCTKSDYGNKLKVKAHNIASKKLRQLQAEMKQNDSEEVLNRLLNHIDDRVKVNAASFCLQTDVLVEQAVLALKRVIVISEDASICLTAKMLLQSVNN